MRKARSKYSHGRELKFMNPVHQNYGHIKALESYLNISEKCFYNIVVLAGDEELNFDAGEITRKLLPLKSKDKTSHKEHMEDLNTKLDIIDEKLDKGICPKCGGNLVLGKQNYYPFTCQTCRIILAFMHYMTCKRKRTQSIFIA